MRLDHLLSKEYFTTHVEKYSTTNKATPCINQEISCNFFFSSARQVELLTLSDRQEPYRQSRLDNQIGRNRIRLRYKGHMTDALALTADERRSKLRKAAESRKQASTRGYLNGATPRKQFRDSRIGEEPGEVKHLSTRRKRNRRDSLSSGERKGKSLNPSSARRQPLLRRG